MTLPDLIATTGAANPLWGKATTNIISAAKVFLLLISFDSNLALRDSVIRASNTTNLRELALSRNVLNFTAPTDLLPTIEVLMTIVVGITVYERKIHQDAGGIK